MADKRMPDSEWRMTDDGSRNVSAPRPFRHSVRQTDRPYTAGEADVGGGASLADGTYLIAIKKSLTSEISYYFVRRLFTGLPLDSPRFSREGRRKAGGSSCLRKNDEVNDFLLMYDIILQVV